MTTKPTNEFHTFIDALVDELIATPDEQILEGHDPAAVHAKGLGLLQAAKTKTSRSRLAAAKTGYAALKSKPTVVPQGISADEARRFLAQAANDPQVTLAARNLGELSDEEAMALYSKFKSIESPKDGDEK